ncbi:hypothetical protein I3760_16G041900 [Carya illinoinensis]|nr:hypothetical protein I3760_16G041900 [Carya illinoinensis]
MENRISEEGESSRPNYPEPMLEFTEEKRNIIKDQLTIYAWEAEKLNEEAHHGSTRCIYRVLPRLKEINGNSYEPNMVGIGPYYYKQREVKFQMAEDCKRKCLGSLLVKKSTDQEMQINTYMSCLQRIKELEEKIRKCYSEELGVPTPVFLEMMVVDACFIIEIITMFRFGIGADFENSLAALGWMVPYFYRDFLLLENRIPFFVLVEIYTLTQNISLEESKSLLVYFAWRFFSNGMKRSYFIARDIDDMDRVPVLHLLDLVRRSSIPSNIRRGKKISFDTTFIHCISKLRLAGMKVSQGKALSPLEVKFKRGVIEMPNIAIDDLMRCVLLNCVAFEQCHQRSSNYFSVYATFLDCLVNTEEDIEYLRERNVIDNYLANDKEAAEFINHAGKDLVLNPRDDFYLWQLFEDVDRHYRNRWKWKWASFERAYIDKPWLLLSAAGGILLVVATSFQAVMAFLTYKYKNC